MHTYTHTTVKSLIRAIVARTDSLHRSDHREEQKKNQTTTRRRRRRAKAAGSRRPHPRVCWSRRCSRRVIPQANSFRTRRRRARRRVAVHLACVGRRVRPESEHGLPDWTVREPRRGPLDAEPRRLRRYPAAERCAQGGFWSADAMAALLIRRLRSRSIPRTAVSLLL
ncbi:hypothetical protein VTO42DRAFT_2842 [Malbranchea cinnamomea]